MIRVVLCGPESTGKTTMCTALAQAYGTSFAAEAVREWVIAHPKPSGTATVTFEETAEIALLQVANEDAAVARAHRIVFFDTDLLGSVVYSHHYLGRAHPDVERLARERVPDLYLLLAPDVPWVPDGVRDRPDARDVLFDALREALLVHDRPFVELSGSWARREATARESIDALLAALRALDSGQPATSAGSASSDPAE